MVQNTLQIRQSRSNSVSKYAQRFDKLQRSFQIHDGYHSDCYKNFTAISEKTTASNVEPATMTTRFAANEEGSNQFHILPKECIFCGMFREKVKGSWVNAGKSEKFHVETTVREAAVKMGDEELLLKIGNYKLNEGPDIIALEAHYHHQC